MAVRHGRPLHNITEGRSRFYRFFATVAADQDLYALGPNDGEQVPCAEIHVFGAGDLVVTTVGGTNVTLAGLPAGAVLPISARALVFVGTTATNILVLW